MTRSFIKRNLSTNPLRGGLGMKKEREIEYLPEPLGPTTAVKLRKGPIT